MAQTLAVARSANRDINGLADADPYLLLLKDGV
jgi:hypothetical protein